MSGLPLHLLRHPEEMAIVRLEAGGEPEWDWRTGPLASITHTTTETTVVCAADRVPEDLRHTAGFTPFEVGGPLDFSAVGITASLMTPLAAQRIPVLSLSTYETDWILVPGDRADDAQQAWRDSGFYVTPASLSGLSRSTEQQTSSEDEQ